jgi:hypothetical protein
MVIEVNHESMQNECKLRMSQHGINFRFRASEFAEIYEIKNRHTTVQQAILNSKSIANHLLHLYHVQPAILCVQVKRNEINVVQINWKLY